MSPVWNNLSPNVREYRISQLRDSGDLRNIKGSVQLGSRTSLLQDSEDVRGVDGSRRKLCENLALNVRAARTSQLRYSGDLRDLAYSLQLHHFKAAEIFTI